MSRDDVRIIRRHPAGLISGLIENRERRVVSHLVVEAEAQAERQSATNSIRVVDVSAQPAS